MPEVKQEFIPIPATANVRFLEMIKRTDSPAMQNIQTLKPLLTHPEFLKEIVVYAITSSEQSNMPGLLSTFLTVADIFYQLGHQDGQLKAK